MYNSLKKFSNQFEEGLKLVPKIKLEREISNVIICGMGGSAMPYDLITTYINASGINIDVPIFVSRDYQLPKEMNDNSLIFASSFSGNTEEPISCLENEALMEGLQTIGFSSGGKLEEICKEHKIPHIKYPKPSKNFQPRWAVGYSFAAMSKVLWDLKIVPAFERDLLSTEEFLATINGTLEKEGEEIAEKIFKKIPIVYCEERFGLIARIFKININENGKIPAFWNVFPEMNHNEMIGYTFPEFQYHCLFLKNSDQHPRISKRMEITKKLLEEKNVEVSFVDMKGESVLQKMFSSVLLSFWVGYFIAQKYGIDPAPVAMVEDLKKMLKRE